jgi:predicted permease
LVPALTMTRRDTAALNQRGTAAAPRLLLGRALLAVQIGVSVPLVVTAGLLVSSLANLGRVDLGFNPEHLVTFRLDPTQALPRLPGATRPSSAEIERYARDLLQRIEALPGVASATLLENALISGWVSNNNVLVDGQTHGLHMNGVGPRYFETMQVPLLAGRAPSLSDVSTSPRVAVVNESAAARLFNSPRPIGRQFTMGGRDYEVIGVAADSRYSSLRAAVVPTMFDPFLQRAAGGAMHVVVRTRGDIAGLDAALRRVVAAVPPNVPLTDYRTQRELVKTSAGRERLVSRLMTVFGGFALLLASIGLYGATSYAVGRRTNEMGVRVALGAQRWQVVWMVLRQVFGLAAVGLLIGVPAALAAGPLVGALLYDVGPREPGVIAAAALILLAVARCPRDARRGWMCCAPSDRSKLALPTLLATVAG